MLTTVALSQRPLSAGQLRIQHELRGLDALLLTGVSLEGGISLDALLIMTEGIVAIAGADAEIGGELRLSETEPWLVAGELHDLGSGSNPAARASTAAAAFGTAFARNRGVRLPTVRAAVSLAPELLVENPRTYTAETLVAAAGHLEAAVGELLELPTSLFAPRAVLVGIVDVYTIMRSLGIDLSLLPNERALYRLGFGAGSARLLSLSEQERKDSILRAMANAERQEWESKQELWAQEDQMQESARELHLRTALRKQFQLGDSAAQLREGPELWLVLLSGTYPLSLQLSAAEHECSGAACPERVRAQIQGSRPHRGKGAQRYPISVSDAAQLREILSEINTNQERFEDEWKVGWPGYPLPSTDPEVRAQVAREHKAAQTQAAKAEKKPKWFSR